MKKLMLTTAAAALMFATAAQAQDTPEMYMITAPDGTHMVVSGSTSGGTGEEMPVMMEENFAAPADCPEGSFYMTSETSVAACGDDTMAFDLSEPEEGSMMASGEAWPEGAMMMNPATRSEEVQPGDAADLPQ